VYDFFWWSCGKRLEKPAIAKSLTPIKIPAHEPATRKILSCPCLSLVCLILKMLCSPWTEKDASIPSTTAKNTN
jgi:hypothetical protein